jgi:Flp pilus assembly protein TadD
MFKQISGAFLILSVAACSSAPPPKPEATAPAEILTPEQVKSYVSAADASREDGRFSEAIELYQQVLMADKKSTAAQYGVAECLLGMGDPTKALTMFTALTKEPSLHAVALQGEGLAHLALKQRDKAAKELHDAIAADAKLWRSYNGLGMISDAEHEFDAAAQSYHAALVLNPDSALLHNNLGYSHLMAGKPDEALAEFSHALALDPSSETVRNNYRLTLAAKGDYSGAIRGVSDDRLPMVLNNVGYVAMQRGDLSVAEAYLTRAMEKSPSYDTIASENLEQLKAKKGSAEQ